MFLPISGTDKPQTISNFESMVFQPWANPQCHMGESNSCPHSDNFEPEPKRSTVSACMCIVCLSAPLSFCPCFSKPVCMAVIVVHPLIHSFIHFSFIHSFIHPNIQTFLSLFPQLDILDGLGFFPKGRTDKHGLFFPDGDIASLDAILAQRTHSGHRIRSALLARR